MLAQVKSGEQGTTAQLSRVVYRAGTEAGLVDDDHTITDESDNCMGNCNARLTFMKELDDGTFLMNRTEPTRVFAGARANLQ